MKIFPKNKHILVELIEEEELEWSYSPTLGFNEIDIVVEDFSNRSEEDLVANFNLDWEQVTGIEDAK